MTTPSSKEMTAKEKVLARWPEASCWVRGEEEYFTIHAGRLKKADNRIGGGNSVDEAWADAASRLRAPDPRDEVIRELVAPVIPKTLTEYEQNQLFFREGKRVIFYNKTAADYRNAVSGDGPLAGQWNDKPHRLVYDLLRVIDEYHQRAAAYQQGERNPNA